MNKNIFQYIMVINNIHLLYDNSKRFPLTSNYMHADMQKREKLPNR